jgi:hypothetical protein
MMAGLSLYKITSVATLITLLLVWSSVAIADWLDESHIFGSNTLRVENYAVRGNQAASPYRYEGAQAFDEFSLNLNRRVSPYESWRGQFYGVINGSAYRSEDRGFVPERVNLFQEKGDGLIPYRVEVGDYFGFFSFRTLQRSLKGAQLELQPFASNAGQRHSLLLLTGANQPSWRHFEPDQDYYSGFSWLIDDSGLGRFGVNFLHNRNEGSGGTSHRNNQAVWSIAGENEIGLGAQRFRLEGEAAGFAGDHDGDTTSTSGRNRKDYGIFFQVSRRAQDPLTFRLRYERYGQDYRPNGAVITSDRQSGEGHIGWLFASGLQLRGRVQYFRDGLESGDPTDTYTVGVNFTGPFLRNHVTGLIGAVDVFAQDQDKRDGTIDLRTYTANINFSKPIADGWLGRLGLFIQRVNDFTAGPDTTTHQYTISSDRAFNFGELRGVITPGVLYRRVRGGSSATDDGSPTLALSLAKGPHQIRMNLAFLDQNPSTARTTQVGTGTSTVDYRYTFASHTFGIEFNQHYRGATPGQNTQSYRVSAFWTYAFDKPPVLAAARPPLTSAPLKADGPLVRGASLMVQLPPGSDLEQNVSRLEAVGISGGVRQPGVVLYETRILEEIEQRQRLALVHDDKRIANTALIVEFEDVGNRDSVAQTFERVRRALLDRFGNPAFNFEEGNFAATFAADVNSARFIRIMEWQSEVGRVRLGVPRRLDGQVRIEVQHARSFPPPRDTLWSVETVR